MAEVQCAEVSPSAPLSIYQYTILNSKRKDKNINKVMSSWKITKKYVYPLLIGKKWHEPFHCYINKVIESEVDHLCLLSAALDSMDCH